MQKNNRLVVGNKIEFINRRPFEERRVVRAEIVKINKKTVKAVSYATSGWNSDEEYSVRFEDILAVVEKNKIHKVK